MPVRAVGAMKRARPLVKRRFRDRLPSSGRKPMAQPRLIPPARVDAPRNVDRLAKGGEIAGLTPCDAA